MKERLRTSPNLLDNAPEHQKALAAGRDHFGSWQYNVIDKFKSMDAADIKVRGFIPERAIVLHKPFTLSALEQAILASSAA